MKTKGFTLVELLVVIAILAILATVSVVGYTSFIDSAKDSNAETELHQVVTYLEAEMLIEKSFDVVKEDEVKYTITRDDDGITVAKYTWDATNEKWVAATAGTNDFDAALDLISDFDALKAGTFTIDGFKITYTSADEGYAEDTLSFH